MKELSYDEGADEDVYQMFSLNNDSESSLWVNTFKDGKLMYMEIDTSTAMSVMRVSLI